MGANYSYLIRIIDSIQGGKGIMYTVNLYLQFLHSFLTVFRTLLSYQVFLSNGNNFKPLFELLVVS